MVKVEVIESFTLGGNSEYKFEDLQNIIRGTNQNQNGHLFVGDIFECNEEMLKYLTKTNPLGRAFVKVIEIQVEKIEIKSVTGSEITLKEEEKPKRKTTRKKSVEKE